MKSAGQVLIEEFEQATRALQGGVTPIFHANEKGEAELLGSAVLISVSGEIFLCTAKHVIDGNTDATLYINGISELQLLTGDFYTSLEHDVAVLKLTTDQIEALGTYAPIQSDNIANVREASNCKYGTFVGFPETKNRPKIATRTFSGQLQSNGCTVIEITSTRVRLRFNRKRNINSVTRQYVTAPAPEGMSGGAVFGAALNDDTIQGHLRPMLIAISTDRPNMNEVFGTNIAVVLAIIRDAYAIELPPRLNRVDTSRN